MATEERRTLSAGIQNFDFKDVETLQRFLTPQGRIHGRKRTGLDSRRQRRLMRAIKYARFLALLPYTNR